MGVEASIVIPSFEGGGLLPTTLAALAEALDASRPGCEVILVDDASRDGSAERAARAHPELRVLRQPRNRGFGPSANAGAHAARAPVVVFLNSDVSVHPGFLEPLLAALEPGERFAAAALQLDEAGRARAPSQVAPSLRRGQIRLRSLDVEPLRRAGRLSDTPVETLFGSGAALAVRRDRFLALGGFDDVFAPFYYEDADLGWRAWRRGWSSCLAPASLVTHREGGEIAATHAARRVRAIRKRNRFLLVWRNLLDPGALRRRHLLPLPAHLAGALLRGDASVLRGLAAALPRRRAVAAFRARERAEARLADAAIFARLAEARAGLEAALAGGADAQEAARDRAERDRS